MIVNYTWRMKCADRPDAWGSMREFADRMIRSRPYLLDCEIFDSGEWLYVTLRFTDIDRWRIKAHARKTITTMARKGGVKVADVELYGVAEVANRRTLQDGEGRTPRPRRPRSREPQLLESPGVQ